LVLSQLKKTTWWGKWGDWILWSLVAVVWGVAFGGPASAADTVGLVDSQKILFGHPRFDETTRLLLFLTRPLSPDEVTRLERSEDKEMARLAKERASVIKEFIELDRSAAAEKDQEKKTRVLETRQAKLSQLERQLMEPIMQECRVALEAVAAKKKMTTVLELESVYYGGADLTEEVIQQLKAGAGKK
jgi:outer membrane protein